MKVIIIGCTHAGLAAAREILKNHPETTLTIYERNNNFSFSSDGIFLYLKNQVKDLADIFISSPKEIRQLGATVREMHNVLSVDTKKHQLRAVDMNTGNIINDTYDKLIVTTGANVRLPAITGIDNRRVLVCKSYLQSKKIYELTQESQKIAIVGAGYVGVELAESLVTKRHVHKVDIFQSQGQILNNYFDIQTSDMIADLLKEHGITVHLNSDVSDFTDESDSTVRLITSNGNFTEDMAIVCTGFVPNTRLFTGQLAVERHGALLVNSYLQTSDPDVYAAGDCTVTHFNPTNKDIYFPLGTNAVRQGLLVARNIYGHSSPYMGTQATSALKLFDHNFATTGLTLANAKRQGLNAFSVSYTDNWRPKYMPDKEPVMLTLVYDRDNRKILGLQLASKHDITLAVNVVSVAIQNRNTIDDLSFVDMFFQPNYSRPFNYLNLIAQKAVEQEWQAGFSQPRYTYLY
ncbi:FAD-dependent oxidoreductase [Liquorilactobacillus mali]|uniref:FAD-dependent oxidoreductase n=1 Tax=Liquorilactobacillus mali TaxID=1618 RepID=UPI002954B817|nr:FAD-dependent oxidoreductase [Liquorilactobacillus mali]MDV7757434.1 SidA/IucD/PvdA family monooxygenase [Liquorilactobacillus mali]